VKDADLLRDSEAILEKLLIVDPGNRIWSTNLTHDKVAGRRWQLRELLTREASNADASIDVLELATSALLQVRPQNLRNPRAAVQFSERLVALDHRRTPQSLALLAQAYRQDGQAAKAVAARAKGLL
jgi:hypothetical protein